VTREKEVSTLRLAVGAIAGPIRVRKSGNTVVAVAVEVQSKVGCGFEILEPSLWIYLASAYINDPTIT
jgi:hypothetical protein